MLHARIDKHAEFVTVEEEAGASLALDRLAESAAGAHGFLRAAWFGAAADASLATLVARRAEGAPVAAIPTVSRGKGPLRLREVPGSYWPYRSFPVAGDAGEAELAAMLASPASAKLLGRAWRLGPIYSDDPTGARLAAAAREAGWTVLRRRLATSYRIDLKRLTADGPWPSTKTLRKNRWLERRLEEMGALEFRTVTGADWSAAIFDTLAGIEKESWVGAKADAARHQVPSPREPAECGSGRSRIPPSPPACRAACSTSAARPPPSPSASGAARPFIISPTAIASASPSAAPAGSCSIAISSSAAEAGIETIGWGAGDPGYKSEMGAEAGPEIVDYLIVRGRSSGGAGASVLGAAGMSGAKAGARPAPVAVRPPLAGEQACSAARRRAAARGGRPRRLHTARDLRPRLAARPGGAGAASIPTISFGPLFAAAVAGLLVDGGHRRAGARLRAQPNRSGRGSALVAALAMVRRAGRGLPARREPGGVPCLRAEDSPLEWGSALLLLVASGLFAFRFARELARRRSAAVLASAGLLAAGFFVLGMEEVSWMQRLFGFGTPERLAELNWQAEFNVHNMQTDLAELVYYAGAGLFLGPVPLLRDAVPAAVAAPSPRRRSCRDAASPRWRRRRRSSPTASGTASGPARLLARLAGARCLRACGAAARRRPGGPAVRCARRRGRGGGSAGAGRWAADARSARCQRI